MVTVMIATIMLDVVGTKVIVAVHLERISSTTTVPTVNVLTALLLYLVMIVLMRLLVHAGLRTMLAMAFVMMAITTLDVAGTMVIVAVHLERISSTTIVPTVNVL